MIIRDVVSGGVIGPCPLKVTKCHIDYRPLCLMYIYIDFT